MAEKSSLFLLEDSFANREQFVGFITVTINPTENIKKMEDLSKFEQSEAGHFAFDTQSNPINCHDMSKKISYKTRLNILKGRWTPETSTDIQMLREFKKTRMKPERFLKKWQQP